MGGVWMKPNAANAGWLFGTRNDGAAVIGYGTGANEAAALGAAKDNSVGITIATTGDIFCNGDVSALTFTDRTKGYEGDALAELANVRAKDGELDHDTLPEFARAEHVKKTTVRIKGKDVVTEIIEPGRDLGAMISILTVAVQQLAARVEELEGGGQ
jgi:hypothetical protein